MKNSIFWLFAIIFIGYIVIESALRTHSDKNLWEGPDGTRYKVLFCDCKTPITERLNCGVLHNVTDNDELDLAAGTRVKRVDGRDFLYIAPSMNFDCTLIQWRLERID